MTPVNEATRRQHDAARPHVSTWLSANAGSGKTRVLTDRVARLLLGGVQPQHILCLTYTKAAASEMQNRLFKRLGEWAMLDDGALRHALAELGFTGDTNDAALRHARTLFARAIETPGGLKIQTIHSFCASLLRRFPLEAEVSPQFTEIEDRAADLLRRDLLDQMADGPDTALLEQFARVYSGDEILKVTAQIVSNTGQYGFEKLADACPLFGLSPAASRDSIAADTFAPGDDVLLRDVIAALRAGSSTDMKAADALARVQTLDFDAIPALAKVFVFGEGAQAAFQPKIDKFPTKPTRESIPHLMSGLNTLMQRVADARDRHLAMLAAEQALALHRFARRFAMRYAAAKQDRAWLDFDDLIQRARALLNDRGVAAWVLYRLDGGIDHILVDEAQDTSPAQWDVIRKLAEEFSTGEGARSDVERTLFVVGDKKQSIYSFQGADPRAFDEMRAEFVQKLHAVGDELYKTTLDFSFRSSPAILRLVDMVFDGDGTEGFAKDGNHIAFHTDMPGRVDLWPIEPKPEDEPDLEWFDPVDRRGAMHHDKVLADKIASEIKRMIDDRVPLPDGDGARPVQPRDFLILVQRRGGIFGDLIRACKAHDLPIAGADRLKVGAELAVRDLGALLAFLATPEDSLSLATALRSPLFGWSEQDLFTLAHHRTTEHLWQALRVSEDHPKTVSILQDMRSQIDFLRPYDLIERMLIQHGGRKNLLARLGAEAEDGIDALLSQALAYERSAIPSLTGFLTWLETDDLEIKRQIDSASNQIRVMTVHGSKGLEAPIVILPECGPRKIEVKDQIVTIGGAPVWKPVKDLQPNVIRQRVADLVEAQREESLRLLYVALTRAEKWLILGAAGESRNTGPNWWELVEDGMQRGGAVRLDTPAGEGLRLSYGEWPSQVTSDGDTGKAEAVTLYPLFTTPAPTRAQTPNPLNPSQLDGAKALPGEARENATEYGTFVHLLLETLAGKPADRARQAAVQMIGQAKLPEAEAEEAVEEALAVLADPALAHLFAPGTLAEVPMTATLDGQTLYGTIDRLIVTPERVTIVDFKSNRLIPATPNQVPEGLLRQMGAYARGVAQIYPGRAIDTAILWTHSRTLMSLPHDIVLAALDARPIS
ncbi:MAG: double-strand break repair helicase AddA [Pseudomonadota bacterium]